MLSICRFRTVGGSFMDFFAKLRKLCVWDRFKTEGHQKIVWNCTYLVFMVMWGPFFLYIVISLIKDMCMGFRFLTKLVPCQPYGCLYFSYRLLGVYKATGKILSLVLAWTSNCTILLKLSFESKSAFYVNATKQLMRLLPGCQLNSSLLD